MAIPRRRLINIDVTRWYLLITDCVRALPLLQREITPESRSDWIRERLDFLTKFFGISLGEFSCNDTSLEMTICLTPEAIDNLSDREVVERWSKLCPPRNHGRPILEPIADWIERKMADKTWIMEIRGRLKSTGWFMKMLKEPIAKSSNRTDGLKGAFFSGRYESYAILDSSALEATDTAIRLQASRDRNSRLLPRNSAVDFAGDATNRQQERTMRQQLEDDPKIPELQPSSSARISREEFINELFVLDRSQKQVTPQFPIQIHQDTPLTYLRQNVLAGLSALLSKKTQGYVLACVAGSVQLAAQKWNKTHIRNLVQPFLRHKLDCPEQRPDLGLTPIAQLR